MLEYSFSALSNKHNTPYKPLSNEQPPFIFGKLINHQVNTEQKI